MANTTNNNEGAQGQAPIKGRRHRATYARDRKKGGYLVRVAGPAAAAFAGRTVPVSLNNGTEHEEELLALVWTGVDRGDFGGVAGMPVALYTFKATPRASEEVEPF